MAKTLAIMRHGKSSWDYGDISDFDRPLKESGISNTQAIAQKIKGRGIKPDMIVSSPANRALHTALITARELLYPLENVVINPVLYGESEDEVLNMIKHTNDRYHHLFIFGHNPVFTDLSNLFLKQQIDNLPTSGVVILNFETEQWMGISGKVLKSEFLLFPKSL